MFSRIRTEYGETLCPFPCFVQMRENTDQKTLNTDTFHVVNRVGIALRYITSQRLCIDYVKTI